MERRRTVVDRTERFKRWGGERVQRVTRNLKNKKQLKKRRRSSSTAVMTFKSKKQINGHQHQSPIQAEFWRDNSSVHSLCIRSPGLRFKNEISTTSRIDNEVYVQRTLRILSNRLMSCLKTRHTNPNEMQKYTKSDVRHSGIIIIMCTAQKRCIH